VLHTLTEIDRRGTVAARKVTKLPRHSAIQPHTERNWLSATTRAADPNFVSSDSDAGKY